MPEKLKEISLPRGISKFFFRMPIALFHARLGFLFGHRFVLLTHIGRKSGKPRENVLEIVRYDHSNSSCIIASGWGEKSDWYQNVSLNPKIKYQIGNQVISGVAIRLSKQEASIELIDYAKRHPAAWNELAIFMGYKLNGTEEDVSEMGEILPMFRFAPNSEH